MAREYGPRSLRWRLGGYNFGPFDGGLNLRDAPLEVAPNELTDGTNFTLDERGIATKRNDCPASIALPTPPGNVTAAFYSQVLGLVIIQVGATLYKCALGGGSWTSFKTLSTSEIAAFVDFASKLCYTHPTDGLFTYDGTTNTLQTSARNGTCIAAWQTKLFVGGIPGTGNVRNRLHWSALGDPTTWSASDFQDFKEKDDKSLTALFGGSGLIVFKDDSSYRVNDSTNGSYQTIDWTTGCVGARAVTAQDGMIFVWGTDGLYKGNGFGRFSNVGDKMHPRFFSSSINATTKPLITATNLNGRVYFAFPRTSTTIPDAILEYNPRVGWLMESYFGGIRVGPFFKVSATQALFASDSAIPKDLFVGTTRTGFSASLTTGYLEPFGGNPGRVNYSRANVIIPTNASLGIGLNYMDQGSIAQTISLTESLPTAGGQVQIVTQPRVAVRALQFFINDTAAPQSSLSVINASGDLLLKAIA